MRHGISTSCPAFEPAESPAAQTALGCLCILVGIVGQLELFAVLTRRQWIPTVFSRKMAHIGSGSLMTSALVLFPRQYWPAPMWNTGGPDLGQLTPRRCFLYLCQIVLQAALSLGQPRPYRARFRHRPARLAVSLFLVSFMLVFATIAHLPDDRFASLPPLLRGRLEAMVQAMCRTGDRSELMRGTLYHPNPTTLTLALTLTCPNPSPNPDTNPNTNPSTNPSTNPNPTSSSGLTHPPKSSPHPPRYPQPLT